MVCKDGCNAAENKLNEQKAGLTAPVVGKVISPVIEAESRKPTLREQMLAALGEGNHRPKSPSGGNPVKKNPSQNGAVRVSASSLPSNHASNAIQHDAASQEIGNAAEASFLATVLAQGWKVTPATRDQDRKEHWDFLIERYHEAHGPQSFRVEVKAMKKLNRSDAAQQDEWLFLELKNIHGGPGWLYGKADLIAFEMQGQFMLIRREKLVRLVEEKVDRTRWANRSSDAKYCLYGRRDRQDEVTLVKAEDVLTLKPALFTKIKAVV